MIYAKITEQAKCDCVISRSGDSEGSTGNLLNVLFCLFVQEPATFPPLAGSAGGGDALQEGVAPQAGRGKRWQFGLSL